MSSEWGFPGQAQVVQPNRREDLNGLEPLAARLQGTLATRRQVEHAILAQLEGLFPDHAGRGALLHQRDQLFSQRLFGIAAAGLHAEELHQGPLSPGYGGLDALGDPDDRKLRPRMDLARLQAGRDFGMRDIAVPSLDIVLLDHLLVESPPPVLGRAADRHGEQNAPGQPNQPL